jgi:type II secretory pathway predicted ATPase ExeA
LFKDFQDFLIKRYSEGSRTVLIIDEAQNLGAAKLEELRILSNINADKHQLLQLILVGQPQLKDLLQHPDMAQFCQRVSSDFHLRALVLDETNEYIQHRLKKVGGDPSLISTEARRMIFEASGGIPRSINVLCDTALVYGFASDAKDISAGIVRHVLEDKKQFGVFTIDGANDWPVDLKEIRSDKEPAG